MSKTYISKALRERVTLAARHRCGYCLTSEDIVGAPMEIDHCNEYKADRVVALDPISGEVVHLYDPRHQAWSDHFTWPDEGERIMGLTATGRATVIALQLNRPELVRAHSRWVAVGWHPPRD